MGIFDGIFDTYDARAKRDNEYMRQATENFRMSDDMDAFATDMLNRDKFRDYGQQLMSQQINQDPLAKSRAYMKASPELQQTYDKLNAPKTAEPVDIRKYEYAVNQGYSGTLQEFLAQPSDPTLSTNEKEFLRIAKDPNSDYENTGVDFHRYMKDKEEQALKRSVAQRVDPMDKPLSTVELARLRDQNMKTPAIGVTPRDIARMNAESMSRTGNAMYEIYGDADLARARKFEVANRQLTTARDMVFNPETGMFVDYDRQSRPMHIIEGNIKSVWPVGDPRVKSFEDFVSGSLSPAIKALGEAGNLSAADVERAQGMYPTFIGLIPDTPETAAIKMNALENLMDPNSTFKFSKDLRKFRYIDENAGDMVIFNLDTNQSKRIPIGGLN